MLKRYDINQAGLADYYDGAPHTSADEAEAEITRLRAERDDAVGRLKDSNDRLAAMRIWYHHQDRLSVLEADEDDQIALILAPSFQCPGCVEKDDVLGAALAAWKLIRKIVPKAFPNAREWCEHLDSLLEDGKIFDISQCPGCAAKDSRLERAGGLWPEIRELAMVGMNNKDQLPSQIQISQYPITDMGRALSGTGRRLVARVEAEVCNGILTMKPGGPTKLREAFSAGVAYSVTVEVYAETEEGE